MNEQIKTKLQELLLVCISNGYTFEYANHVNCISVRKYMSVSGALSITDLYSLSDWNGSTDEHIEALNGFIDKVEGHE